MAENDFVVKNGLIVNTSFTANSSQFSLGSNLVVNTSAVFIGNSSANNRISSSNVTFGNSTVNTVINAIGISFFGSNLALTSTSLGWTGNSTTSPTITIANTGALGIGNSITTQTGSIISVANSTGNVQITPGTTSILATGVINAASHTTGAGFNGATAGATVNVTTIGVSTNTTVNSSITPTLIQISNSTSVANLTAADLKIGAATTVNSTQISATLVAANLTGTFANISGHVNTTTLYAVTSANIASAVQANSTGVWTTGTVNAVTHTAGAGFNGATAGATVNSGTIGISSNTTVNASVTSSLIQVSNSTATTNVNALGLRTGISVVNTIAVAVGNTTVASALLTLGGQINANGSVGSAGQVLTSSGAANAYWVTLTADITGVEAGNGLTGGGTSGDVSLAVGSGNGISVSADAVAVTGGDGLVVNATGVHVRANSGIVANSTGTFVLANSGIVSNSTGVFVNGGDSIVSNSLGVFVNSNTGLVTNSTGLHVNATYIGSLTANNTSFVGVTAAAAVVNSSQLSSNLSNYAPLAGATFSGPVAVNANVTITGNLIVTGTTMYANVTNLDVADKNITVAKGAADAASTDGAGLTVDVSGASMRYTFSSNTWEYNIGLIPSANNSWDLGLTGLRWRNVFANNIVAVNISGDISGNGTNLTSVNAATVGGNTAATLRSYSDTVAGTAYSNAVSVASSDASSKAGTAYSNAVSVASSDASSKAGTAYSNAVAYAPSKTGSGASGTWDISVTGNAGTATLATKASTLSQGGGNGTAMTFNYSGQSGQPTWLWGTNDGTTTAVYNPGNFNVNYATTAGSSGSVTNGVYTVGNQTIAGVKTFSNNVVVNANIDDSKGEIRRAPINNKSSAYTLIASDSGKTIWVTSSGGSVTIPANVFTAGDMVTIFNDTLSSQSIIQGTDLTIHSPNIGSGTKTLASGCICTALFLSTTYCVVSGSGLS